MATNVQRKNLGNMVVCYVPWTSNSPGTVTIVLGSFGGQPMCLITDPGSPAPDADYDVVIEDEWGNDVLAGHGADRHTSNIERLFHGPGHDVGLDIEIAFTPVVGELTLKIIYAGSTKSGELWLYIKEK